MPFSYVITTFKKNDMPMTLNYFSTVNSVFTGLKVSLLMVLARHFFPQNGGFLFASNSVLSHA